MDKQQWLKWRKIGSSDAPVIMNESPFSTPYELWQRKINGEQVAVNRAMQRGNELEVKALESFEKKLNVFLKSQECLEHPKFNWMTATLDGYDGKTLVEIKCPGQKDHGFALSGKVPEKYIPQLQHQLEVTGLDGMYYFSFDGNEGVIIEVQRDQKYIDKLLKEEEKFWKCVQENKAPALTERDFVEREGEWISIASKRNELAEQMKLLERQDDELKEKLIALSDDRNSRGGSFKFTRSEVKGRVDYDAIPELQGVDLERFRKKSSHKWQLSVI